MGLTVINYLGLTLPLNRGNPLWWLAVEDSFVSSLDSSVLVVMLIFVPMELGVVSAFTCEFI